MNDALVCWKCGADIGGLPQPLGRRAECLACHAELHVCRMCRHFDPAKAKQCREPVAEDVKDKTRANFCDWFQVGLGAFKAKEPADKNTRGALEALFGGNATGDKKDERSDLDRLFGD